MLKNAPRFSYVANVVSKRPSTEGIVPEIGCRGRNNGPWAGTMDLVLPLCHHSERGALLGLSYPQSDSCSTSVSTHRSSKGPPRNFQRSPKRLPQVVQRSSTGLPKVFQRFSKNAHTCCCALTVSVGTVRELRAIDPATPAAVAEFAVAASWAEEGPTSSRSASDV
jgi:hypothetical protein